MRGLRTAVVLVALLLVLATTASAVPPPLPSSFWGVFTMNGARVALSAELTAHIDDIACGKATLFLYQGATYYSISVKGDIPDTPIKEGGVDGDVIQFWLNGIPLATTAIWSGGINQMLDLVETSPHRSTATERLSLPIVANEYSDRTRCLLIFRSCERGD
jgi:hypothetical protein